LDTTVFDSLTLSSKLLSSPIAAAAQEGVHIFLQDGGQHLPGPFPHGGLQNILDLVLFLASAVGREFSLSVLQRLLKETSEDRLLQALE
jgi:hypothetical protein